VHVADHLFDHQLDVGSTALEAHHRQVFEADQRLEDLTRVDEDAPLKSEEPSNTQISAVFA